jgi:hypothetical protein
MDGRHSPIDKTIEKPFVNHATRNSIRAALDFLILFLLLRTVDLIKNRSIIKNNPWSTCFTVAMLYFKLRDTLNPLRDKAGLYAYLLGEKPEKKRDADSQIRPTLNVISGSPILVLKDSPTEVEPSNLKLN